MTDKRLSGEELANEWSYLSGSFDAESRIKGHIAAIEAELAAMTKDRDGWMASEIKHNKALGKVIAERDSLRTRLAAAELVVQALRSVLSEEGVREHLASYVMGVEMMNRLEEFDKSKGET